MSSDEERYISGVWTPWNFRTLLLKGIRLSKLLKSGTFLRHQTIYSADMLRRFSNSSKRLQDFPQVASDSEKEAYARAYFEKEGIQLDLDKIAFNPPRRSIMKFLLNSLWGRFALRCNLPTTELLTDPEDFARYIFGNDRVIKHFSFVSDTVALVQWCYQEDDPAPARDVNIFIASFTTAYGRLELYKVMDRLGPRVFYVDTTVLSFLRKKGNGCLKQGHISEID